MTARKSKQARKKDVEKACPICQHEDRDGIEMLGLLAAVSWRICARRINNTFDTSFTPKQVEEHMTHHMLHKTATEAGVLLGAMTDTDRPFVSVENMLQTLMIQGMLDLAKGSIRCKTPSELMNVMNMLMRVQDRKRAQELLDEGDAAGYYAAMAAYAEAMRDTVSPEQLQLIVLKAKTLGAHFNIGNIPTEHPLGEGVQGVLDQVVMDEQHLGRGRTRKELADDGVIQIEGVDFISDDGD